MKKILITTLLLLTMSLSVAFALTDVDGHWAKIYIDDLIAKEAINGYEDGTFRPENTITTGEFTKILVAALGHDEGNASSGHWASKYFAKAKDLGLIKATEREFSDLSAPIDRGMMARMISRALDEDVEGATSYIQNIKDYDDLKIVNKLAVLKVYGAGIITGYPDGSFKDLNTATRAEATTMLSRLLSKDYRKTPGSQSTTTTEEVGPYTQDVIYGTPERLALLEKEYGYIWDEDLKEGLFLDSYLSIEEKAEEGDVDFFVSIQTDFDTEPQYKGAEYYLSKWLTQKEINKVMRAVLMKSGRDTPTIWENIYVDNKYVFVRAMKYSHTISIIGLLDNPKER